jgi:general secretion pathway protein F
VATFRYQAVNFAGETVKGEMEAANSNAVVEHLHRLGFTPLAADKKTNNFLSKIEQVEFFDKNKFSTKELAFLTQQLSMMIEAGLSLEKAINMLAALADKPKITTFLNDVAERMRHGSSFADALASQKIVLPKAYIGMIRAGEAGGGDALKSTLDRLALHLSKMQAVRDTISSAMLYPVILLFMALLSIAVMFSFVLPQFEPLFNSAGDALPFSTRIVMNVAHGLRDYGFVGLVLILIAGIALRQSTKREIAKARWDAFLLQLPKINTIITKSETSKFCRTLGDLLSNGISLVMALTIALESFGNKVFVQALEKDIQRVREGEPLSTVLTKEKLIPSLALQMIRIGEETGHLDEMLLKVAGIYDRDVERSVNQLMTLLAPLLTIIMGLIIGTIIASILSAILSINDLVT